MTTTTHQAADTPTRSDNPDGSTRRLVVVNAGTSNPSSSRLLTDRIAAKTADQLKAHSVHPTVDVIDLGPLAGEIAHAIVSGHPQGNLLNAVQLLANADGVIITTPVYKAGISGLLKAFIDILDNDLLIATPVVLAATAGSARHALVIDDQLRPLFAFMRSLTAPTSVFAAPEDWSICPPTWAGDRESQQGRTPLVAGIDAAPTDLSGPVRFRGSRLRGSVRVRLGPAADGCPSPGAVIQDSRRSTSVTTLAAPISGA